MTDNFCRCGHRLSVMDIAGICLTSQKTPPPAPVVPVELTRKWLGVDSNGRKLCRCGAVVAYRSMCAPCSARDVRERRKRNPSQER